MSIKILVADDSITIQKVIGIIFGGDEYSLTVVDNGKAAVDKAREINPDILLIDALMPGMTGYEVAEAVRSTPSLADKPILILTGTFEVFDEEKAKKSGADDFIAKPFESQQIITKVKELLELGKSRVMPTQAPLLQPVTETFSEQTTDDSIPTFDSTTVTEQQLETPQTAAPADIWGAFTPEVELPVEPPVEAFASPDVDAISEDKFEPDVFAIVTEENDAELVQNTAPANTSPQLTGTQWVPIEENTFEFEEETSSDKLQTSLADQEIPVHEPAFGDISFEKEIEAPASQAFPDISEMDSTETIPAFDVPSTPIAPFAPLADPTPVFAAPVDLDQVAPMDSVSATAPASAITDEQLKAILAGVSKDVIERIVWEVVPDLAEAMIREAIQKIKEGV
ncbi:MAG: response regulator [Geobacteraceae bacterium]|nr:response regulator [Geobacteraceae bacterium]NTW79595.1 response regulator [Geobacteraceae bacterium]